jgi:hypothetical protein
MARSELVFGAEPAAVWSVLSEPRHYGYWVVGSSEIRDWDADWPAPGTRFHHRVGAKPFTVSDHTEVVKADPPNQLVLRAKARPFGVARVEILIESHPAGSLVTMIEDPDVPLAGLLVPPPIHALIRVRNGESLRRLRGLAERESVAGRGSPGRRAREHAV